jgi:hypothetical protein
MRTLLLVILQFTIISILGQNQITFVEPLQLKASEKINAVIKKGDIISAKKITCDHNNGYPILTIIAETMNGSSANFDSKKLNLFEFIEVNNINKVWDKHLLLAGSYSNLLTEGYQYELRYEQHNDAVDYINTLSIHDRFFNDDYFEDYLYTLINKIHSGILKDERPGNLYIKILKEHEPNAFALPNGCIVISTGLLSTIQSEDELVGILAHEIAHFALDHQILNYNKEIDRKKRAEFWASFATIVAAGADTYLAFNNENYIPGILTASTAIVASAFSADVITRLGIKYNQTQEVEADNASKEILKVLSYDSLGLSIALSRIKNHCILTGNYLALSGSGTHPSLDSRINHLGQNFNLDSFIQPTFLKKVSLINSYNAWIELWHFANHTTANNLVNRNYINGVATESDYIVKAIVLRRLSNTQETNEEVLKLLNRAKSLNVTPNITLYKEEGITHLRMNNKIEAKKSFQDYLSQLIKLKEKNMNSSHNENNKLILDEIEWTSKMIFKVDVL